MVQPVEKIIHKLNSIERFKNILRHEHELKWIKRLQTPFPRGFNDNIYHEGNPIRNTILNSNKLVSDLDIETSFPDS